MNAAQDKGYWSRWGAVVRAHSLNKLPAAERDEERRQLTLEATKGRTSSHKDLVDNKEITRLFRLLEFTAQPESLKAARPVANPEEEEEADEQRKTVFALRQKGLKEREIQTIADPLCRRYRKRSWYELPSAVLKEMARWKQFTPDQIARKHATPTLPLAQAVIQPGDGTVAYQLRPFSYPGKSNSNNPY